jgi:hypothetical protein
MRQSLAVPAIELAGCTTSQASVARIVADLRAADGVKRVSLSSANKSDVVVAATTSRSTTDSGSAGAGTDCTQGNANRPKFSLTIFYDAPANPATATPTTTTPVTTASGTSTTAGSTSTPTSTTGG